MIFDEQDTHRFLPIEHDDRGVYRRAVVCEGPQRCKKLPCGA
jgi:hypothetical protein